MRSPKRAAATLRRRGPAALLLAVAAGCTPSLDWRQARPEGSGATMLFPCRPASVERPVQLAGSSLSMRLHSCVAGGATFSLAVADAVVPDRVTPLLVALREQAVANVAGQASPAALPAVAGATPNAQSALLRIEGRLPDGRPVVSHAAFFVCGTRLYQATIIGTGPPAGAETLENFFATVQLR